MRVFWLDGGLRIQPETSDEIEATLQIEKAIRVLSDTRIAKEVQLPSYSDERIVQAAFGSANNDR
jgi:hypothetical protein